MDTKAVVSPQETARQVQGAGYTVQSLTVVILRALSFHQAKWETSGGCCKHSETLALVSAPHLYETGNVITAFLLQ